MVHKHEINAERDVLILLHDSCWYVVCCIGQDTLELLVSCFAFDQTKVATNDSSGIDCTCLVMGQFGSELLSM